MQRRQMAILVAAVFVVATVLGLTPRPASAATPFTDIATSTFKSDIDWMYNEGVTSGCAPTLFCPKNEVTRGQMASFLVRMFDLHRPRLITSATMTGRPTKRTSTASGRQGSTTGCAVGKYCPEDTVTRGEMAVRSSCGQPTLLAVSAKGRELVAPTTTAPRAGSEPPHAIATYAASTLDRFVDGPTVATDPTPAQNAEAWQRWLSENETSMLFDLDTATWRRP